MQQNSEETTFPKNIDVASAALSEKTLVPFLNSKFGMKLNDGLWYKRVPYIFHKDFENPKYGLNKKKILIEKAIDIFNKMTEDNNIPVVFITKHEKDEDYVCFAHEQNKTKATVGKPIEEHVNIVFIADWANVKDILHEMMHVLGFQHEHQRGDVEITLTPAGNSRNANASNNSDLGKDIIERLGIPLTPYDPKSIMHYPNMFVFGANSYRLDCRRLISIKNEHGTPLPPLIPARPAVSPYEDMIEAMIKISPYIDRLESRHYGFIYRRPDNEVQCVLAQEQNTSPINIPSSVSWKDFFTKSDIYGLDLLYGQGKCNRCLSEESFVQVHCICKTCNNQVVCAYCAFAHHQNHLNERSFKRPKETLLTEDELQEFEVTCNCDCNRKKVSILSNLFNTLESLLTLD